MRIRAAVVSLSLCGCLLAQEFRATLTGRITDPSGAVISGARIEAKSAATGALTTAVSGDDGTYVVPFLTPGEYSITVEREGFRKAVRESVRVQVAERAVLDIALTVGAVTESVTVEADTALVQTETADRGLTIESKRVWETPLQGRNIFAQAWSAPGVIVTAAVARLRPFDIAGSSGMAISGGRPSGNEVLIDGTSNISRGGTVAFVPSVEATAEFRVQTTSYDAQYGLTTGGVVNIITRGGTNEWHGSAFEFLQNTHLNANTFQSNRDGIPRQSSHINTFGGDAGGPIMKNKLFGIFAYEHIRQVIPDPFVTSVPTDLQKSGDFSQTFFAGNALQTIYNPYSTTEGTGGTLVRTAFDGNRIPANLQNAVAKNVFALIPPGNVTGDPVTRLNNLTSSGSTRKFTDYFPEYTGRVDYNFSDRTRMFVRYSRNALAEERGFHYSTTSTINKAETSGNTPFKRENHSATIQFNHTLSPTTVIDVRLGLARFLAQSGSSIGANTDLAAMGFSPQFARQAAPWFPRFTWALYEGAGAQPSLNDPISQNNSLAALMSKSVGRHNLRIGGGAGLSRIYVRNPGFWAGNFNFTQLFTGRDALRTEPANGNALASFLLGTPANAFIDVNAQPARQARGFSLFIQDDFRVTPKLKLNAGLRWDYVGPMTDRFNAISRGFDRQSQSPLQVPGQNLRGGLLFAGVGGNDRGSYDKDWNNFGPRFGAAYQLTSHTVLRGGYGLIYANQLFNDVGNAPGFNQRTDMVTSIRTGIPHNTLATPFPDGILQPVGNQLGLATFLGQGFNVSAPGYTLPWTHQFSFEVQRELPGNFLVTAAYVGSRTRGLPVAKGINEMPREAFDLGATELSRNVTNPLAGSIPGTALNGATVPRNQLLRPFIQFQGITEFNRPEGKSKYDSFQLLVYKRLSRGLNFSVAYTNAKIIEQASYANAQDTQLEKVVATWDVPQSLQLNGVYELPFGRGKPIGSGVHPVARHAISGWEVSGITRLQAGMPLPFPTNAVPTGRDPRLAERTLDRWFNTCTQLADGRTRGCLSGDQPVWTVRQAFTLQTWSTRLASIRRPRIGNLDVSVLKNNRITERINLIFRTDFLNATNTPQFFDGPIIDVNSGVFGQTSGARAQSNLPRFIQFSLKIQF